MPPLTVDGVLLLGWMEREEALWWLRDRCWFDPPLNEAQADELWKEYRARVAALPERNIQPVVRMPIPQVHRQHVNNFLTRLRGPEVTDVLNINPLDLVVHQTYVVTERANHHAQQNTSWAAKTLVIDRPAPDIPIRYEDKGVIFSLPHAEHMIALQPDGAFRIHQGGGFVSVVEIGGRLLLSAGYHRSFAFARAAMNEPDAIDRCELVALTVTLPAQVSAVFPNQGLRTMVLGSRPPLFSDFFSDLAMTVKLRKKRWEAHIKIVDVDATS